MSVLLIDVGNTRIKFGVSDKSGQFEFLGACDTHSNEAELDACLAAKPQQWTRAVGVCVASSDVQARLQALIGIPIEWLSGATPLIGLRNDYATPHTLGADRWLGAYGALKDTSLHREQRTEQRPFVLATFGTATTVDAVFWNQALQTWVYLGGIIIAGLGTAWQSVSRSTAHLPDVCLAAQVFADGIPNNTQSALQVGALLAQAGAVKQFSALLAQHHGQPDELISGGAAPVMSPYLPAATLIDYPVLKGLTFAATHLKYTV
jgi:type III pantothenate kinase